MRSPVAMMVVAALAGVMFAGCDSKRIEKLEEGVATEADVRAQFGQPASVSTGADGSKVLEYPRQPEGWTNYVIAIGADGRMSALRQQLTPANFAKVVPGMDKLAVIQLLGRTARTQFFQLKGEEVWDWRFKDGQESKLFSATFGRDGRVVNTGTSLDPREMQGAGR